MRTRFHCDANGYAYIVGLDGVEYPLEVLAANVNRLSDGRLSRLAREHSLFWKATTVSAEPRSPQMKK